jgi:hypothetical protein|tara:strand:+ start:239 stop:439 length:201 start_codon:yes stop_codon:yes gene_type:complete
MYNQQELNVMLQALLDMNIKGSDAIYMATLQTKINENIQKLITAEEEKERKAKEILEKSPKKSKTK